MKVKVVTWFQEVPATTDPYQLITLGPGQVTKALKA
jgi:hypothetical protein